MQELAADPNRRFVYVELAFFWMWWNQQSQSTKQLVRKLVDNRQLEFVIGAWCMNDEASTYYNDIIDQQTLGLQFILREFGECARPRVAWQLDPFGHSREQASLFAQFGFDGLFLGRIDYQDSIYKSNTKTREFVWQGSSSLGLNGTIFTGVLPNVYQPPPGFCFDELCDDEPIMDDPTLEDYNVNERVDEFISYINQKASEYKTNNLILTMGSDFQYSNARMWFKNLDKLIYHVNQRQITNNSNINVFYSTPSCYLYSLYKSNLTWPTKQDDFFPYAHRPHSFWTGYFTSRPNLKYYVRQTNNYFQAVRQLSAIAQLTSYKAKAQLDNLERAMGVAQHHDAVSGTEKQHVARDYAKRLSIGTELTRTILTESYAVILASVDKSIHLNKVNMIEQQYCPLLNISLCVPIENKKDFSVIIYNPLARTVETTIRLPVSGDTYHTRDASSGELQTTDISPIHQDVLKIPERSSKADHDIVFNTVLPPLGFRVFNFSVKGFEKSMENSKKAHSNAKGNVVLRNEHLELAFDSSGMLQQVSALDITVSSNIQQEFCYYESFTGVDLTPEFQSSGAYIFRPKKQTPTCLKVKNFSVFQGDVVQEVHQVYDEWISQTIRLYKNAKSVEFEWQVGPIPVFLLSGREVITKFNTDLRSSKSFYTDSNGREILKRVRDFRPGWEGFNQTEPVSGNYYPVNSRIFIKDEEGSGDVARQLTIVTDRSHGASSIDDGSVEIMLHRRILSDDALGVSEPLDELGINLRGLIARGKHYLFLNTTTNSPALHRDFAHKLNMKPILTFPKLDAGLNVFKSLNKWTAIGQSLPENVEILTLMPDFYAEIPSNNSLLVRFEHFYERNEDTVLALPVTINIMEIFSHLFRIENIEELSLGANMAVDELNERLKWNLKQTTQRFPHSTNTKKMSISPYEIQLEPMQIRTFRIHYSRSF